MSIVTIKEVKGVVTCDEDGSAAHVFNIRNTTESEVTLCIQVIADAPARVDWLTVDAPDEQQLTPDTVTQIQVNIAIPGDVEPGKYSYRLRAYDPESPGERFTEADAVYFTVSDKKPKPVPEKQEPKKKSWLIPAIIVLAAVIVAGVVMWTVQKKPESTVKIPKLVGDRLDVALEKFGTDFIFNPANMKKEWKGKEQIGKVVAQAPEKDKMVPKNTEIFLTVGKSQTGEFIKPEALKRLEIINPRAFKTFEKKSQP